MNKTGGLTTTTQMKSKSIGEEINMSIASKRKRIEEKITQLQSELSNLQEQCNHPNLEGKYKADTGNYLSADRYWVSFYCPDCNAKWDEDQDEVRFNPERGLVCSSKGLTFREIKNQY